MPKITLRKPLTIVISLEGLATSAIGAYGCSWNSTPAIDSMSAQGIVWDRWTSPVDEPAGLISLWLSQIKSAASSFQNQGRTTFLTDSTTLDLVDAQAAFDTVTRIDPVLLEQPAGTNDQTSMGHSFAALVAQISPDTSFAWLHLDALCNQWDAPLEPREEFVETPEPVEHEADQSDDPLPAFQLPINTRVPRLKRQSNDDPDLVFAWMQRYASQIRLLDELIDLLLESAHRRRPAVVLAASSGMSLGQNGWIGHRVGPLRSNEIRLPLIVSGGDPLRAPMLLSAENFPTLLERISKKELLVSPSSWCEQGGEYEPFVKTASDRSHQAITTPQWFFVSDNTDSTEEHLFLKPDDVEDVNDIARLRREVVQHLSNASAVIDSSQI